MQPRTHGHPGAALAGAGLVLILCTTLVGGSCAVGAYLWHIYRLFRLNG